MRGTCRGWMVHNMQQEAQTRKTQATLSLAEGRGFHAGKGSTFTKKQSKDFIQGMQRRRASMAGSAPIGGMSFSERPRSAMGLGQSQSAPALGRVGRR